MAKNRNGAVKFLLENVQVLDPSGLNRAFYTEEFKRMSDKDFELLASAIVNDGYILPLFVPTGGDVKLTSRRAVKLARKHGHEIFQRLRLTDPATGETYLTPHTYMVIYLPLRRQSQLLIKKMSMPAVTETVDASTGQATGPSKGSALSFPEIQVLSATELNKTIEELIKVRGGDAKAYRQFSNSVIQTGRGTLEQAKMAGGRVKSTETLHTYLTAIHLDNNL